ncbi:hypothetical protein K435DRAFT_709945 [Dendrothele bispora CBS 962.96]|uniref:SAC3/GANP/THP3 conserved domain-containing protein n=1 Tax=Dendrothele bispora (strain CBS 962.96) TaxID=1314807 RepID=A0A4S8MVW7_DENBC|nr:hypothetical protein K435DRAFT_709945 [Dendrothele bispora CBS 962.96]
MEASVVSRHRGRGNGVVQDGRKPHSRNKIWVAGDSTNRSGTSAPHHGGDGERWERGGHRGGGRGGSGRGGNRTLAKNFAAPSPKIVDTPGILPQDEPVLETQEERDEFYRELVKAREVERKKAIAEGKMDDPLVPKRLEDAITMVGTCMDMCPRFERYRRERENNLFEWEVIPGTKRVDHQRAVKMYERAAGDKTLPSDLRPPHILKQTLDYLFHELLPRGGFSPTFNFIRDRSRAVRNDFTIQHETGELAIECYDRCARFHILALHFERDREGFSIALEEQQLMNTLQSLKEFYEDQRGRYESPNELEMRVYHRLIHIRDQKERHDDIPSHILEHPVFKLTTEFRLHVQRKSAPITKTSNLVVDPEAMQIFGNLASVLKEQGNVVMIYLVACILERLFGKETIEDIESIRGNLSIPDIIDGVVEVTEVDDEEDMHDDLAEEVSGPEVEEIGISQPQPVSTSSWPTSNMVNGKASAFGLPSSSTKAQIGSAFSNLQTASTNVFGTGSVFGAQVPSSGANVFGAPANTSGLSAFAQAAQATSASIPSSISTFGAPAPPSLPAPPTSAISAPTSIPAPPQLQRLPNRSLADAPPLEDTSTPPVPAPSPFALPPSIFSSPFSFRDQSKPTTTPANSLGSSLNPMAPAFKPPVPTFGPPQQTQSVEPPKPPPFFASPAPVPNGKPVISFSMPPSTTPTTSFPSTSIFSQPPVPPPITNTGGSERSPTTGLPRINTTNLQPQSQPAAGEIKETHVSPPQHPADVPPTPTLPPPPRPQPISLPPTPTVPSAATSNPRLAFLKGSLVTTGLPSGSSSTDILSPLQLNSPTVSRQSSIQNFAGLSTPVSKRSFTFDGPGLAQGHPSPLGGKGKGKAKASATSEDDLVEPTEEEITKAVEFARKSYVVKSSFTSWKSQAAERLAYAEAVRNSDEYKAKLLRQNHTIPKTNGAHKRRISSISSTALVLSSSADVSMNSPVKKRARHRESRRYQAPITDDELAKRLKENQEDHQHWWAQGSLLRIARDHIKGKAPMGSSNMTLHRTWRFWVSFNPVVDSTAIWLQRKFSVPNSGSWLGDVVFSIPLTGDEDTSVGSPGVIIFECTPLEGVDDELERKYRVLDDCARLRDIIKALPPKRCFVPSLCVFFWSEGSNSSPTSDFLDMVNKLVEEETLGSYAIFPVTTATKDLDLKFSNMLASIPVDVEGKLVRSLTLSGIFKFFNASLNSFAIEWIESISIHGQFNWVLYGRLVQCVVALLNAMMELIARLLDVNVKKSLPSFPADIDDNESAYETVIKWLDNAHLDDHNAASDLQVHRDIGKIFPARTFVDHLQELVHINTERLLGLSSNSGIFHIPLSDLESSSQEWRMAIEPHQVSMSQVLTLSLRRSPKRRSLSTADTESTSKRLRLSASGSASAADSVSYISRSPTPSPLINGNGRLSLSPDPSEGAASVSTATEGETPKPPTVTVAMLRALTKNLKEKYGASAS